MDLAPIFKAYDVRGTYPDQIDEAAAEAIGAAFARFTGAPTIIVGRDMRLSSPSLAASFIGGVTGQGADALDIGMVSTDALYFASGQQMAPGAMFTASHNPGHYNGIKLCLAGAAPVGQDTGLSEVRALAEQGLPPAGARGEVMEADILPDFTEHLKTFIDLPAIRPLKVVVDAANGMGGKVVPPVFQDLPVEMVPLYFDLDGTFPNHPADPIQPENLVQLIKTVVAEGADLGLAFDGDADRVFLIDNEGAPVSGSLTTALVAARVLAREPGARIVHNLICSRVVPETVRELGGEPIRTRVGHSFIKQVMAETGAAFGGEHSGHYYFRDNFRADSGLICALLVIEALSLEGRKLSEVLLPFQRYWNSGEINTPVKDQQAKLGDLAREFSEGSIDHTDGLTVDFPDWWFNARGSNTEPLLRLNVEASDPAFGATVTERLLEVIRR